MGRRHALVVAYDFPPHSAIGTMRTLRVVQRLCEENWDVTVLTGAPHTFRPGTPVDNALLSRVPPGVRVVRAQALRGFETLKNLANRNRLRHHVGNDGPSSSGCQARRTLRGPIARLVDVADALFSIPDHESGWLGPAVICGLRATWSHRPDVLYSSAPPWTGQLVASIIVKILGCPWVADFRDPWSRAPWRGDRFRFAIKAAGVLERMVVARADHILFVAAGNRDDFAAHYGAAVGRKFHLIPNGCDPEEFDRLERPIAVESEKFILLHAGSLYAGRTPVPLFNAIAAAIRDGSLDPRNFRLRFLGTVARQSTDLVAALRQLGIEEVVEFAPRVPREDGLRQMIAASALLLLQPGHTVSVPGKLYEYFAAGRPILAIAEEGETAELVRGSGIGLSVPPSNERGIVSALNALQELARGGVQPPPRELFDGRVKAAQAVAILDAVARGGRVPDVEADAKHEIRAEAYIEREARL